MNCLDCAGKIYSSYVLISHSVITKNKRNDFLIVQTASFVAIAFMLNVTCFSTFHQTQLNVANIAPEKDSIRGIIMSLFGIRMPQLDWYVYLARGQNEYWIQIQVPSEIVLHPYTKYRQISNTSRTVVGNKIVDHADVVAAAPVQPYLHSRPNTWLSTDWAKSTARRDDKHVGLGFDASYITGLRVPL